MYKDMTDHFIDQRRNCYKNKGVICSVYPGKSDQPDDCGYSDAVAANNNKREVCHATD